MLNNPSPTALANRIQQLLDERQQHEEAIERIGQILEQIEGLLDERAGSRKRGRKLRAAAGQARPGRGRYRRGEYATTAVESILAFVKDKGNPTTQEIKALWKQEGRGGSADNVLSKLVKDKMLKRTPMKDQRGSRYSIL